MARLPLIDIDNLPGPLGRTLRERPRLDLYRVLPHAPEVAEAFLALGSAILRRSSLPPDLRELVILRVGALSGAAYEIHQHSRIARGLGMSEERIQGVLADVPAPGLFSAGESAVLAFTDAVVRDVKAPQALYTAMAAHLDARQQVELLQTIGFYMLVSRFLENLEIHVEDAGAGPLKVPPVDVAVAPQAAPSVPLQQIFGPALGQAVAGAPRMQGRRILVVGAGQRRTQDDDPPTGNGRAIALLCAREGATVACADIDLASAGETVDLIRREGGTATALQADVSRPADIERLVQDTVRVLGGFDGLVLNVGIGNTSRFGTETAEAWDAVMAVNLRAHMLCAQAAAAAMDEGSTIVFVSSTASISPLTGIPAYECSKAALAALCRAAAYAGHGRGLRANVIAPGLIDTPLGRDASRNRPTRAARPLPFGRQGTAWEVAHATLFLVSSESSYVNGQVLIADGGLSISAVRQPA